MTFTDALDHLREDPNSDLDVAEVALLLAKDEYTDLDIPSYIDELDTLAETIRMDLRGDLEEQVSHLSHSLFGDSLFEGNAKNYYDPRNSYLNDVLELRSGNPISLSVLAMAVGQRCGLRVDGIGLPGHFIAQAREGRRRIFFDPFHEGNLLDLPACEVLVSSILGRPVELLPDDIQPVSLGLIMTRMLNNLKKIYLQQEDYDRSARVIQRLIELNPEDLLQHRDLGVVYVQAGSPQLAIQPLEHYLGFNPDALDRAQVEEVLSHAKRHQARR
jgi:regulator of sirC expression with transglutaminase-like and TPR domain